MGSRDAIKLAGRHNAQKRNKNEMVGTSQIGL